jgi:hypothetical protein
VIKTHRSGTRNIFKIIVVMKSQQWNFDELKFFPIRRTGNACDSTPFSEVSLLTKRSRTFEHWACCPMEQDTFVNLLPRKDVNFCLQTGLAC